MKLSRHEKGDGFKGNATGAARECSSAGKEFKGAVRQKQHDQSKEDAAGVETPSQQDSGSEDRVIVEVDCGRGDGQKSRPTTVRTAASSSMPPGTNRDFSVPLLPRSTAV